ncbi:uncharacterized protein LOC129758587 isoform X1 [Uranotaenia lowii]|uniref:uncharacterized protein LOC129758587 isoform X1 n=1 Tax=Uranotaenia lowii TaxID=190385 RepID=UPI002479E07C|nr:uncharacterized protein LOC129758587 isoform X1 [Uranotaenia lowii]
MSQDCFSYIPSVGEYFTEYKSVLIALLVVFTIALLGVTFLYVQVVKAIRKNYRQYNWLSLILCNGIYMIILIFSIVSLVVPVLSDRMDLLSFVALSWCIYAFFWYIRLNCGGDEELRNMYEMKSGELLTGGKIKRKLFRYFGKYSAIKFYIVQFPFVATIVSITEIAFYFVNEDRYYRIVFFFLPVSIVSIVLKFIAFLLLIRYIKSSYPDSLLEKKFRLIRLVVLAVKIQVSILQAIFRQLHFDCDSYPGQAWSIYNFVKQPLIVAEISVLAYLTWKVYRSEAKK